MNQRMVSIRMLKIIFQQTIFIFFQCQNLCDGFECICDDGFSLKGDECCDENQCNSVSFRKTKKFISSTKLYIIFRITPAQPIRLVSISVLVMSVYVILGTLWKMENANPFVMKTNVKTLKLVRTIQPVIINAMDMNASALRDTL